MVFVDRVAVGDEGRERAIFLAWVTGRTEPHTEVENVGRGKSLGWDMR